MENEKNREIEKTKFLQKLEVIAVLFLGTLICTIDSEIISGILFFLDLILVLDLIEIYYSKKSFLLKFFTKIFSKKISKNLEK